jgi:hypothetical protein
MKLKQINKIIFLSLILAITNYTSYGSESAPSQPMVKRADESLMPANIEYLYDINDAGEKIPTEKVYSISEPWGLKRYVKYDPVEEKYYLLLTKYSDVAPVKEYVEIIE